MGDPTAHSCPTCARTSTSSAADVTIDVGPSIVVDQADTDELAVEDAQNTVTVVLDDHEYTIAQALAFLDNRADVADVIADLITDTLATYADDFDVQRLLEIRDGR